MKRETSGRYPGVDLPDLSIVIFLWKVSHVHCTLVSCMPLHISLTFVSFTFSVKCMWLSGKTGLTLLVCDLLSTVSVSVCHLSCRETSCLFHTVAPFHFPLVFSLSLFIISCPPLLSFFLPPCSFVHPLLLIFPTTSSLLFSPVLLSSPPCSRGQLDLEAFAAGLCLICLIY